MAQRYTLISDDDGHWYVCPADKVIAVGKFFEAVRAYWEDGHEDDEVEPSMPRYLSPVGGAPSLVSFTDPAIEGKE